MFVLWILCSLVPLVAVERTVETAFLEGPPRFKQNTHLDHQTYLGDKLKLRCGAVAKPPPSIFWYKHDELVDYKMMSNSDRMRESVRHMTLDIKRIEANDAGEWKCVVWNRHGNITRKFNVDVVDMCDYYLSPEAFPAEKVPMECVCFWKFTNEQLRTDINFTHATIPVCRPYQNRIKFHARQPFDHLPCFEEPCNGERPQTTTERIDTTVSPTTTSTTKTTTTTGRSSTREITTISEAPRSVAPTTASATPYMTTTVTDSYVLHGSRPNSQSHARLDVKATDHASISPVLGNAISPEDTLTSNAVRPTSRGETDTTTYRTITTTAQSHTTVTDSLNLSAVMREESSSRSPVTVRSQRSTTHAPQAAFPTPAPTLPSPQPLVSVKAAMEPMPKSTHNYYDLTPERDTARSKLALSPYHDRMHESDADSMEDNTLDINDEEDDDEDLDDTDEEEDEDEDDDDAPSYHKKPEYHHDSPPPVEGEELTPLRAVFNGTDNRVRPHFIRDSELDKLVMSPAGRTVRLSCKSSGVPAPSIIWYKDTQPLHAETVRRTGGAFRMRGHTLEMEDSTESDSGQYKCFVYNMKGEISRQFNVTVMARMRSAPFIVPNVLLNQTVNVNDTAVFKCKVISDLMPHIIWLRIEKHTDGNYFFYNETAGEYMFKYTEAEEIKNAKIIANGSTSTLILKDVKTSDQGIYTCVSGNALGKSIANATLTVNEFQGVNLLTGEEKTPINSSTIILAILLVLLVILLVALGIAFYFYKKMQQKKIVDLTVQEVLIPKNKMCVVARKREPGDPSDGWSDLPYSYHIQIIEKDENGVEIKTTGMRLNSEFTSFNEFEVETDPDWEIQRDKLKMSVMLGEGAFGEVWRAKLVDHVDDEEGQDVAVKRLKASAHQKELIDLFSEAQMFKIIGRHENILGLVGCCTGVGPLFVVLELCAHGNLRDFLRSHRPGDEKDLPPPPPPPTISSDGMSKPDDDYLAPSRMGKQYIIPNLTQRHLVEFASQVAKGMKFMSNLKVIHRDLAARNVLVTHDFVMKISDFGLSRNVQSADYYRKKGNGRLPIKWMALEALDSHVYTVESDVWSFGILLWEIMTLGGTPYPTIAMPQLYSCLKEGYRMEAPHNCPEEIYNLMVACWQENKDVRPTFETIVDYFDWMLAESASADENGDEEDTTVKSGSSGDFGESTATSSNGDVGSLKHAKKMRPLSAPVLLPSEPAPHDICDDEDEELLSQCEEWLPPFMHQGSPPPATPCSPHSGTFLPVDYFERRSRCPPPSALAPKPSPPRLPPRVRMRSPPPPPLPIIRTPTQRSESGYFNETTALIKPEGPDSAIGSPTGNDGADEHTTFLVDREEECDEYDPPRLQYESVSRVNTGGADTDAAKQRFYSRIPVSHFNFAPHVTIKYTEVDGVANSATVVNEEEGGKTNLGYIPSALPRNERSSSHFSIASASSGRGHSSAASSAEGLGASPLHDRSTEYRRSPLKRQASSLDETGDGGVIFRV